jgi:multidrug resistance protein
LARKTAKAYEQKSTSRLFSVNKMSTQDLEKQDQLRRSGDRRDSTSDSFCDCDEESGHHGPDSPALTPTTSQGPAGTPLQLARSYITCLSDDGTHDTTRPNNASNGDTKYEVKWDGDEDPMNPRNMNSARKWLITFTMALCSTCVTCTSSLYTMTYNQIIPEFGSSRIAATLGLSLFVFGLGLSPMVLGPLSEFYGRRPIYIGAFVFFTVWLIPCAVAPNIETMLIARFFDGLSGSAFLSVAGGTVGDMFAQHELQAPMMIYTASPFVGPGLGPVIGGFINYYLDWRWSFYILLIWSGLMMAAIIFLIPETYHPVVSSQMILMDFTLLTLPSFCAIRLENCAMRLVTTTTKHQLKSWIVLLLRRSGGLSTVHF